MHVCSVGIHLLGISVAAWEGLRCLVTQPLANKTLSIPQRTRHSVAHGWVSRCLQVGMNGADGAGDWPDTELQLPHQMAPPARPRLQCCRHTANIQRTTKFRSSFHNIWSARAFTLQNLLKQYYDEWMLYNMAKVHKAACPSVQFKVDSRVFKHQLIIVSCLVVLCAKALVGAFISKKALFPFSNIVKTTYSIIL